MEKRGIVVVDSLPVLEQSARDGHSAYHREGHWNSRGHSLAAELLAEPLRQALARAAR